MANSGLKLTKRPRLSPTQQFQAIRTESSKSIKAIVSEDVRRREAAVSDWQPEHRPNFEAVVSVTSSGIKGGVFISNPDQSLGDRSGATVGDLWKWHNEGTKAHEIVASGGGVLRFEVSGQVVFSKRVFHPGTKGHHDDTQVTQATARNAGPKIDRGLKEALREVAKKK